jgi:hypothetical protein
MPTKKIPLKIDRLAKLSYEDADTVLAQTTEPAEHVAALYLLGLYRVMEKAINDYPGDKDQKALTSIKDSLTHLWEMVFKYGRSDKKPTVNTSHGVYQINMAATTCFDTLKTYQIFVDFFLKKNEPNILSGLRSSLAKQGALGLHCDRENLLLKIRNILDLLLSKDDHPEWKSADYFNYIRNDEKNNAHYQSGKLQGNLLISDEALKEEIRKALKTHGHMDRMSTSKAMHVKRNK